MKTSWLHCALLAWWPPPEPSPTFTCCLGTWPEPFKGPRASWALSEGGRPTRPGSRPQGCTHLRPAGHHQLPPALFFGRFLPAPPRPRASCHFYWSERQPGPRCSLHSASGARTCAPSAPITALASRGSAFRRACSLLEDGPCVMHRVPLPQPRPSVWPPGRHPVHVDERGSQTPGPEQGADRGRLDQRTLLEARTGAEPALRRGLKAGQGLPTPRKEGVTFLFLLCSLRSRAPSDGVGKGAPPAPGFCF